MSESSLMHCMFCDAIFLFSSCGINFKLLQKPVNAMSLRTFPEFLETV